MNKLSKNKRLILLELNEINFDLVKVYLSKYPGRYRGLEKLLDEKNISTSAEEAYEELEPWIQWVSVHTGKSYAEHKIFRLGDIVGSNVLQIFEQLELAGINVGGVSPMNAENRLKNGAYFIPDPWTKTPSDSSWWSSNLGCAVAQAVNDNAQSKLTVKSVFVIALGLIRFAKLKHYKLYLQLLFQSIKDSWRKALILDLFLFDVHTSYFDSKNPQFSVLFLNAGAHIQHHYLFNSPFLSSNGKNRNPSWYISPSIDPFSEMLKVYNQIIGDLLANKNYELVVATGLSQSPYDRIEYYYRLKDHSSFLKRIGLKFIEVYPRMTRDFLITFSSAEDAKNAQYLLSELKIKGKSELLFGEIDNRGNELFVNLTYSDEIEARDFIEMGIDSFELFPNISFVAIKNGMHQAKGFAFFTQGIAKFAPPNNSHVKNLHTLVLDYFHA
jgi:hypothetical protein